MAIKWHKESHEHKRVVYLSCIERSEWENNNGECFAQLHGMVSDAGFVAQCGPVAAFISGWTWAGTVVIEPGFYLPQIFYLPECLWPLV